MLLAIGAARPGRRRQDRSLRLQVFPAKVRLNGPEAVQRLVVLATGPDGKTSDRSADARLESLHARAGQDRESGAIRPVADGTGEVVVRFQGSEAAGCGRSDASAFAAADGQLPQRDRARSHQARLQPGGLPRLAARQGRVQALAAGLRAGSRLHGDRQERRAAPGHAVCPRGEPAPAQAHAGRGPRRRQAAGARLGRLSPADALAGAGCAGPARRRPASRRAEGLSRTPADGARPGAAAGRHRGLQRRHRARRHRSMPGSTR